MHSFFVVVPSGLEPELFWTKTRRVASYTTGQSFGVFSLKTVQKYKFFSFGSLLPIFFRVWVNASFTFFVEFAFNDSFIKPYICPYS